MFGVLQDLEECILFVADTISGSMHSVPTVQSWLSGAASTVNVDTSITDDRVMSVLATLRDAVKHNFEAVQEHMNFFGNFVFAVFHMTLSF